jgi:hypothetical protein
VECAFRDFFGTPCGDFAFFAVKSLNRKGLGKVREENRIDQARILVP